MMSSVIRSLTPKLSPVAAPALATASAAFGTSHSHHHVAPTAAEIAAARKEDIILANNGGSYERPYVSASWLHAHLGRVHLLDVSWRLVHTPPTPHEYVYILCVLLLQETSPVASQKSLLRVFGWIRII